MKLSPEEAGPYHLGRRKRLMAEAAERGLDGILVTSLVNIRYLSGFTGTFAMMLFTPDEALFLTDFRYTAQAAEQARGVPIRECREPLPGLREAAGEMRIKKLGFEAAHVSAARLEEMKEKLPGAELVPTKGVVERLRMVKEEPEVDAMKALLDMLASAFDHAVELIRPGAVERNVAVELEYRLRKLGASGPAFDFIVASGPRAAMPHGVASDKTIEKGDVVILDWGATGWGYNCDNTRVFAVGAIGAELEKVYKIALEANMTAIDAVRPGVAVRDIDAAARAVIEKAGYGEAFGHGTGHGVGLEIHEKPAVSWRDGTVVETGMVFTIEPGIYLPGKGGVRVEDMVRVTRTGCETLSGDIPKDLREIRAS